MPRVAIGLPDRLFSRVKLEARRAHMNPDEWIESLLGQYFKPRPPRQEEPSDDTEEVSELEHLRKENQDLLEEIQLLKIFIPPDTEGMQPRRLPRTRD